MCMRGVIVLTSSFTVAESCCSKMNVPGDTSHPYSPTPSHKLVTERAIHDRNLGPGDPFKDTRKSRFAPLDGDATAMSLRIELSDMCASKTWRAASPTLRQADHFPLNCMPSLMR
jgi:hypothetical protein